MIKVILADHQIVFRVGMASALAAEDDIRIVGQPRSIEQLMHGLESFRPHVLILSSAFLARSMTIREICGRQYDRDHAAGGPGRRYCLSSSRPTCTGSYDVRPTRRTVVRCIRHVARGGTVLRVGYTAHR